MKRSISNPGRTSQQGNSRNFILPLVLVLALVAAGAYWFSNAHRGTTSAEKTIQLSDSTKAVLNRLASPVEIRWYSVLDPTTVAPAFFPFTDRVNALLAEFERQGKGNIKVVAFGSMENSAAESAAADGIKPFNLDKGNACYLALAVAAAGKSEVLTDISPEWEPALEFDLSRAIERVSRPNPAPRPSADSARAQAEAVEQVRHAIPNLDSVSVEEGTRILREAATKDLKTAIEEFGRQVEAAQQEVSHAQQAGTATEQQAAIKRLQEAQAGQAAKVREIAARLDAQLNALNQLKAK